MEAPSRPLTLAEVAHRLNVSDRTVWRMVKRGEFAAPRYLGGSARWFEEDVSVFLYRLKRGEVGVNPPTASPKKAKKSPLKPGQGPQSGDTE